MQLNNAIIASDTCGGGNKVSFKQFRLAQQYLPKFVFCSSYENKKKFINIGKKMLC
jgi:hypothetical protein